MADQPGDGSKPGQQSSKPFDPQMHLRRIRVHGREVDYLDVKWRLAWLRDEYPDARITTQDIQLSETTAVFRAIVEIPGGGSATGYGSETRDDFAEFIEKAETKAIGRALAALGYGTQFALDFDLEEETQQGLRPIADAPVERRPAQETPARPRIVPRSDAQPQSPPPPAETPAQEQAEDAPEQPETAEQDAVVHENVAAEEREPFDAANYSWNEFWKWARPLGYTSRDEVRDMLGMPPDQDMTPGEIRRRLIEHRKAQGHDE